MMQDQLDAKRKETQAIRSVVDKAKRMLEGLGSLDVPMDVPMDGGVEQEETHVREGQHWDRENSGWGTTDDDFA